MAAKSTAYERLVEGTSKERSVPASLALEDGLVLRGRSCGAPGEVCGEICFNTGLVGYLEVITDPSYAGQIVVMTYPQIGNYGANPDDAQADGIALRGLVMRSMSEHPSNWRSVSSLREYLEQHGVVAIEGIDTRALVRHIRDNGMMRAVISTETDDAELLVSIARAGGGLEGANHVAEVSRSSIEEYRHRPIHAFAKREPAAARHHVVAYDCGVKSSILDGLVMVGCSVTVVPWDAPADEVLAMRPDGVFLSNGPGDPDTVEGTYAQVERLLGEVPLFGICLGHQMLAKAAGADIEKLRFGHHGINQPVMNLLTKRVEITVQNHGFSVVFPSLGPLADGAEHVRDLRAWTRADEAPVVMNDRFGRIQLTHVNLNDGTIEGMRFLDVPAFSVQYHPEAAPGSTDSQYLFEAFVRLMDARRQGDGDEKSAPKGDYLAIDRAQDRLAGWNLGAREEGAKHA